MHISNKKIKVEGWDGMKVKIFTEGGSEIGLGHLSRCSSLYDEIINRDIEAEFIIYGKIDNVYFLEDRQISNVDWFSEDYLNDNISKEDYCIVDSYLAPKEMYKTISAKSKKALYIDDIGRLKYPKGIVVNPSLNTDDINYPENGVTKYLTGSQYIILRSSFVNTKRTNINENVKRVLITMGGSDIRDLTPLILKKICRKHSDIQFDVVIGNAFTNILEIEENKLENVQLHYNINVKIMKELMLKSDFAITAAGQTIYELLATQTPFIPIKVIDNQKYTVNSIIKHNIVERVINWNSTNLNHELLVELNRIMDYNYRLSFYEKYSKLIDGFGIKRIINELLEV